MSGEYVYRNLGIFAPICCRCGDLALIELHVGTGGNYRSVWVCPEHDRKVDEYLVSGERRAKREDVQATGETGT